MSVRSRSQNILLYTLNAFCSLAKHLPCTVAVTFAV